MAIDYKQLLFKYMVTAVGTGALSEEVCPCCLGTPDVFTEEEHDALHDLFHTGDLEGVAVLMNASRSDKPH